MLQKMLYTHYPNIQFVLEYVHCAVEISLNIVFIPIQLQYIHIEFSAVKR